MGCRCKKQTLVITAPAGKKPPITVSSPQTRACPKCGRTLITQKVSIGNGRSIFQVPACKCGG